MFRLKNGRRTKSLQLLAVKTLWLLPSSLPKGVDFWAQIEMISSPLLPLIAFLSIPNKPLFGLIDVFFVSSFIIVRIIFLLLLLLEVDLLIHSFWFVHRRARERPSLTYYIPSSPSRFSQKNWATNRANPIAARETLKMAERTVNCPSALLLSKCTAMGNMKM